MEGFISQIRDDALATLTGPQRAEAEAILAKQQTPSKNQQPLVINRPFVREWKMDDILDSLAKVVAGHDLERGKQMFVEALCARCHRLGNQGRPVGPDLTAVSRRFSRRDLLQSIIAPSTVVAEKYRKDVIETTDGRVFEGGVIVAGDYRSPTLKISTDPLAPGKVVVVGKNEIASHTKSSISQMPSGLLNTLSRDEILDLLAYIESGGEPD